MAGTDYFDRSVDFDDIFIKLEEKPYISKYVAEGLWMAGNNGGKLGLNNQNNYTVFQRVGSDTNWTDVRLGSYHSVGLKSDGTIWTWGLGTYGLLGLGNITSVSTPVQVGSLTTWASIAVGRLATYAVKTDGTLWSWGENSIGQLGLGDTTNRSSPVQVGALTDWTNVKINKSEHVIAIKLNGTLWSWGRNDYGQLGLGDITPRSSPVQVGALTDWSKVNTDGVGVYSFAIKTDGTLWSWGYNGVGTLGLGDTTDRSSPVQVGSLSNWSNVSTGYYNTFAVKADGTLWSWGDSTDGHASGSSPSQVGAAADWDYVVTSSARVYLAVKTDKSVWYWGRDSFLPGGGFAQAPGNGFYTSSMTMVSNITNWSKINLGTETNSAHIALIFE